MVVQMLMNNPVMGYNLFFCVVIVFISLYGFYQIRNPVVLYFGAGFAAFGISHLLILIEMGEVFEQVIIMIRAIGYILVTLGSYYLIREVIRRIETENRLQESYNQIEIQVRERTADLEQANSALSQEVTRCNTIERNLRESEAKYHEFFTTSRDGVFITDPEGNWIDFNTVMMELSGYESRKDMAQSWSYDLYVYPDDRKVLLSRILREGYVQDYPVRMKQKNGELIETLVTSVPMRNVDGSVKAFFGTVRDVTDWRRTERKLQDLNLIVQHSPAIAFIWKAVEGWPVEYVSDNIAQFGYGPEDFLFGRVVYSDIIYPEDHLRVTEEVTRYSSEEGREEFSQEYRIITAEKEVRWIDDRTLIRRDDGGHITHYQGIILDITERKLAEESLQKVNTKLTMLNSITRHDILNELSILKGYLDLSMDTVHDFVLLDYISKEKEAADSIQWQIEFTSNYQDIGAQTPRWYLLPRIIDFAVTQLKPSGVEVTIGVPKVEIFADPLIEKVFYNLMENSLRHGDHVTAMGFSMKESESELIIIYSDDGVGISDEDKKKLFRKGFGKHTGLGLFLCREILSITNITIRETGKPGEGVRFEIAVPKGEYRY